MDQIRLLLASLVNVFWSAFENMQPPTKRMCQVQHRSHAGYKEDTEFTFSCHSRQCRLLSHSLRTLIANNSNNMDPDHTGLTLDMSRH